MYTSYEYDKADRLIAEVSPENYKGLPVLQTENRIEYRYDKLGRLKAKMFNGKISTYHPKEYVTNQQTGQIEEKPGYFSETTQNIVLEAYQYDENGNVKKKIDGESYKKTASSKTNPTIDEVINDPNTYGVEYTYNLANMVETIKYPEFSGEAGKNYNIMYTYDGLGRKKTEITAYGINRSELFESTDPTQPLVSNTISNLYYSKTTYDYNDKLNKLDVYLLDNMYAEGVIDPVTEKGNLIKSESYDYTGSVKESIAGNTLDGYTVKTSYEYNDLGQLRKVIYAGSSTDEIPVESNTVEYKYNAMGNVKVEKNSFGNYAEYEYDSQGRIISERTYGTGEINKDIRVSYGYDLLGNKKFEIDANNVLKEFEYDELGRLTGTVVNGVSIIDPVTGTVNNEQKTSNHKKYICYNNDGNVAAEVEVVTEINKVDNTEKSSQRKYGYTYDGMGRLIQKVDPAGNAIEKINYNCNSAQIESFDGEDHVISFEYNRDGKLVVTRNMHDAAAGITHIWKQTYDAAGNVVSKADGKGNETVYIYNGYGKLESVNLLEYSGKETADKNMIYKSFTQLTSYTYYINGNIKSQKFSGKPETTYYYNSRNLLMKKVYPGTTDNVETYSYYSDGSLREKRDKNNIKTTYKYYPQGWVHEEKAALITISNGVETEKSYTKKSYTYDNNGNVLESRVDTYRPTESGSVETTSNEINRTYDQLNRVITKEVSDVAGKKALYVYDIVTSTGLLADTTVDQNKNMMTRIYDEAGRLKHVTDGDVNKAYIAEYNYYKNGARKNVIYSTNAKEEYTYYDNGLLKSLVNKNADESILESFTYTYDVNDNIVTKKDKKGTTTYTYDALNRLTKVTDDFSGKVIEYSKYDSAGNRELEIITEGSFVKENSYVYNDLNQIQTITTTINKVVDKVITYSRSGNKETIYTEEYTNGIISSKVTDAVHEYDEFYQLIKTTTGGTPIENIYNAEGLRIGKKVNGSLTTYLYEYDKVVLELDGSGNQTGRNIYGTNLLMRTTGGQSYYYMYNGHADVTALINTYTGAIDATYYYDAFGNITESTGSVNNSITYAGYQYDSETKLYYLNSRMYDPKIARFLQEDTYTGTADDPLSLNLYTYVKNNPLIYYDPTGHAESMISYYLYNVDNDEQQFGKDSDVYKEIKRISALRDKSKTLDQINYYNSLIYSIRNNQATVLDNWNIAFSEKNVVWRYVGVDTYEAARFLTHAAYAAKSVDAGNGVVNSHFAKILTEIVPHNQSLDLSAEELEFAFKFDPHGVRSYWGPWTQGDPKRALREETFRRLTNEEVQYYEDDFFQGWLPTDRRESSWGSRVRSNADFLLRNDHGMPQSATEVTRLGLMAYMGYLGASIGLAELYLLNQGVNAYGVRVTVNMYTSGTLASNLSYRQSLMNQGTGTSIQSTGSYEKISGSNLRHLNGAIAEKQGYNQALANGEIGIQEPGKVTASGPDYITFNPKTQTVNIWDSKYSSTGKWPNSAKGFGSKSWLNETQQAINSISDPVLKQQVQAAFDNGNINWQIFKWPQ